MRQWTEIKPDARNVPVEQLLEIWNSGESLPLFASYKPWPDGTPYWEDDTGIPIDDMLAEKFSHFRAVSKGPKGEVSIKK